MLLTLTKKVLHGLVQKEHIRTRVTYVLCRWVIIRKLYGKEEISSLSLRCQAFFCLAQVLWSWVWELRLMIWVFSPRFVFPIRHPGLKEGLEVAVPWTHCIWRSGKKKERNSFHLLKTKLQFYHRQEQSPPCETYARKAPLMHFSACASDCDVFWKEWYNQPTLDFRRVRAAKNLERRESCWNYFVNLMHLEIQQYRQQPNPGFCP